MMTGMGLRWTLRAARGLLGRPDLWSTAIAQAFRLRRPGWWRTAPFLPVPDADYLRFRMVTAYGDPQHEPPVDDLVTYLGWVKAWPAVTGRR